MVEWIRSSAWGRAIRKARRRHYAGGATGAIAVVVLGIGVGSCQTPDSLSGSVGGDERSEATPQPLPSREPEMRVRIRSGVASVRIDGVERFTVRRPGNQPETVRGPLTLAATRDGMKISDGLNKTSEVRGWSGVEIVAETPEGAGEGAEASTRIMARVDGVAYPGRFRVVARQPRSMAESMDRGVGPAAVLAPKKESAGVVTLDVIEDLPLETYLVGVVAKELYATWPLGAYEVQAVCARTYALHERERSMQRGEEYDVESSTMDQAYDGATQLEVARQGVANTRGVVLTWEEKLLRTYYSSTCGGRSASAADIWPTDKGYEFNLARPIQAHKREYACEGAPPFRWEVTRSRDTLSKQVREWGRATSHNAAKMGSIRSAAITSRNKVGRPTQYAVQDDKGAVFTLGAEELRVACNYRPAGGGGIPEVTSKSRVKSGDIEIEVRGSEAIVRGRGFGHGVGMCQYCAKGFAERGDSWRDMLGRFYVGAKMERVY